MAIQTDNKKTILEDNASIYSEHKDRSDKELWNGMNKKERSAWFKDYYLAPILVGIIVIAIAAYLIYDAVSGYRDTALLTTVINDSFNVDSRDSLCSDVLTFLGCDSSKEKVTIEDSYILSGSSGSNANAAAQRITSYIYAKQLDVIIADPDYFDHYASLGCFYDLREILSEEQLQKYSEYLYYPELEENSDSKAPEGITTIRPDETYPCGIILSDSSVYSSLGGAQTKPVMGIIVTSQRTTNAVKFLDYLFQ